MGIPIRDLGKAEATDPEVVTAWREAAASGCFGIVNHGIPSSTRDDCIDAARQFHNRDEAWKQSSAIERSLGNRGYVASDLRRVDGRLVRDYASLDFGPDSVAAPDSVQSILLGPNLWPDLPGFKDAVTAYYRSVVSCADRLSRILSAVAGLAPDHIATRSRAGISLLRLLHYPEAAEPDLDVGNGHTDYEWFTLIWQSSAGLEVMNDKSQVQAVPAEPDMLIVLIGDLLEVASNGRLQSTLHWVRPQSDDRYSLTFFYGPDFDEIIAPIGPPANLTEYPDLPAGDHLTGLRVRHFKHLRTAVQDGRLRLPFELPSSNPLKLAKLKQLHTATETDA